MAFRLIAAAYEMWKEQKARADAAETSLNASNGLTGRAAFDAAIFELKHIANSREIWWAHSRRSAQDTGIGTRLLKAIDEVRRCFPPGANSDPQGDQITRLHNAVVSYGRILGIAHGETQMLARNREQFETELTATTERFEQLEQGVLAEHDLNADNARKRKLIAKGRDIAHRFEVDRPQEAFQTFVRKQRDFMDIQPHLGLEYQQGVMSRSRTVTPTGDGSDYECAMFKRELARLEKEWSLI